VGGLNPLGFHLVNVLLHLTVTWLLYLVGFQLGLSRRAAVLSAVLFAIHPIHSEAVSGVVGRAELMMVIGVLAALRWFTQGRSGPSLIAFGLGLLSKEQAATLPALLLLYDLTVPGPFAGLHSRSQRLRVAFRRYGPYLLVLMGYGFLRWRVLGGALNLPSASILENPLPHLDSPLGLVNAVKVCGLYLWLCVWPASLSADYSYNAIPLADSLLDTGLGFALLAWLTLLGIAVRSFRRDRRAFFCVGLLTATFLPVSNLAIPIGTIMGERLFYLPSAGLCLLAGLAYERVTSHSSRITHHALLLLLVLICAALLVRTVVRNQDWVSTEHLFLSALRVVPDNAKVHAALGRIAKNKGRWDEAISHFQTALGIYPGYSQEDVPFNSNFGIALIEKGMVAEGTAALERAIQINPQWSLLHYNLGFAYSKQERYREAEAAYRRALSLNDEDPRAYTGLGYLFLRQGRYEEALASAEAALEREPRNAEALSVLARVRQALDQPQKDCMPGLLKC
jgi:Flp pilus assembly protein TadD